MVEPISCHAWPIVHHGPLSAYEAVKERGLPTLGRPTMATMGRGIRPERCVSIRAEGISPIDAIRSGVGGVCCALW